MVETTKVILAKKETVYGTDAVPTIAANAALTRNFTTEPIVTDTLERNLDLPTRGRSKSANTNRRQTFGYELELAGSGTAGTAPAWMEHLEACGMAAPVLAAGVDAQQKFAGASDVTASLTSYHWHGSQRRRVFGARGSYSLDFTAGAYPFAKLDMTGIPHATAVDNTAPGAPVILTRWKTPLEVNTVNTDFLLDGFALVLQQFTLDINADVKPRNLVGANYVQRGNHAITGTIKGEVPDLLAKNYFDLLDNSSQVAVRLTHGTVAGNIVDLSGANLQILKIGLVEEDNVLMFDINYGLNVSVGQDDLLITAK